MLNGYKDRIKEFVSFGKPRIGNHVFTEYFNKNIRNKWRIVNQRDIGNFEKKNIKLFKLQDYLRA